MTDNSRNIYVAGTMVGDTLKILGQTVVASPQAQAYLYLIKMSSDGTVLWQRILSSPDATDWRNLQVRNGNIEGIIEHNSVSYNGSQILPPTTNGYSYGRVTFSSTGSFISSPNFLFSGPEFSGGLVPTSTLMPDGNLLIANLDPNTLGNTYISQLDPAMQTISRTRIQLLISNGQGVGFIPIVRNIQPLPDGGIGVFMVGCSDKDKLVINTDTLTLTEQGFGLFIRFQKWVV